MSSFAIITVYIST